MQTNADVMMHFFLSHFVNYLAFIRVTRKRMDRGFLTSSRDDTKLVASLKSLPQRGWLPTKVANWELSLVCRLLNSLNISSLCSFALDSLHRDCCFLLFILLGSTYLVLFHVQFLRCLDLYCWVKNSFYGFPCILFSFIPSPPAKSGWQSPRSNTRKNGCSEVFGHWHFTEHYCSLSNSQTRTGSNVIVHQFLLIWNILSRKEGRLWALGSKQKAFWENRNLGYSWWCTFE